MKSRGQCIKCNSDEVVVVPGRAGNVYDQNCIGTGFFSSVEISRYLCCNCGYSEEWVEDKSALEKIKKKFK
jgi:hypothetical protein